MTPISDEELRKFEALEIWPVPAFETKSMARELLELRARDARREILLRDARRQLKFAEWDGYVTECGERACPVCHAWAYQNGKEKPEHGYQCGLKCSIDALDRELAPSGGRSGESDG